MFKFLNRSSPEEKKTEASPAPGMGLTDAPSPASENSQPTPTESPKAASDLPNQPRVEPPSAGAEPVTAPPPEPSQSPRSRGVLYRAFSPETRTGRVTRPVLRWLAAITGLFALGLLAGYFLLYQPAQNDLDRANLKLAEMSQNLSQKNQSQATAQMDRDQAVQALQQAQADLKKAVSENDLLLVLSEINRARVALVNKDGQSAKTLIEQAQTDLNRAAGYIETQDKNRSDLLKTRLDLAAKELVSDPQAAQSDLDRLATDLNDLRLKLFKK